MLNLRNERSLLEYPKLIEFLIIFSRENVPKTVQARNNHLQSRPETLWTRVLRRSNLLAQELEPDYPRISCSRLPVYRPKVELCQIRQMSLREKCFHLNRFYIDTTLMTGK